MQSGTLRCGVGGFSEHHPKTASQTKTIWTNTAGGLMIPTMSMRHYYLAVGLFLVPAVGVGADSSTRQEAIAVKQDALGVKHVDPPAAQKLITAKQVIVLDLRTPSEFKSGRIGGATNIDFLAPDFEARIDRLDTNKTYLVHCASGGRSTHSLPVFRKHHFELLYHLDGGIKAWEKAGLPVEK